MNIGIPAEVHENERRVACTPAEVAHLRALGHAVLVERGAGFAAGFIDADYQRAGAVIIDESRELWAQSQLICKVRPPEFHRKLGVHEATLLGREKSAAGKILISFFWPAQRRELLAQLAELGVTTLAMDTLPRISRAQKMDALSSMAHVAGYRAVLEAGQHFGRFFTGQSTAAGNIPPAKVLVIGAGVAGLSAIGAAVSLGAMVRAFDTRPEVREQIESMRAEFLAVDIDEDGSGQGGYAKTMSAQFIAAEMALFAAQARQVDIIISTAQIPGKPAPTLLTASMVKSMKNGSVIVDVAAEQGGNCELTQADAVVKHHGVSIIGYTDLPGRMAAQSSELYAANIRHLLAELTPCKDGEVTIDMNDQVIRGAAVTHHGAITWPPPAPKSTPKSTVNQTQPAPNEAEKNPSGTAGIPGNRRWHTLAGMALGTAAILAVGTVAPPSFMNHFMVFVLACFIGWQVIWNVSPALHTPLMSVTNAISSIIVIGALLQSGAPNWPALALAALLLASLNIAGGFLVTQRMLKMFQR